MQTGRGQVEEREGGGDPTNLIRAAEGHRVYTLGSPLEALACFDSVRSFGSKGGGAGWFGSGGWVWRVGLAGGSGGGVDSLGVKDMEVRRMERKRE